MVSIYYRIRALGGVLQATCEEGSRLPSVENRVRWLTQRRLSGVLRTRDAVGQKTAADSAWRFAGISRMDKV